MTNKKNSKDAAHAIQVEGLVKAFNGFKAVDDISFHVKQGELFGLLGPNGAGKTTTISILSTLLHATEGRALVAGFDVTSQKDHVRRNIGVVFQESALDTKLTAWENLEFHAMMYGMNKQERAQRIEAVMQLVELKERTDTLVEDYSGGMKRRLEIARGLIHHPRVLFLDEPTLGLDAQTRRHIWEYIKQLNQDSAVTIVLTTHYMEEADFLCERVAIMDHGRFAASDTPSRLKEILGGDVVSMEVDKVPPDFIESLRSLEGIKSVDTIPEEKKCIRLTMDHGEKRLPDLISRASKRGLEVTCVDLHKPSLEDVFLHFTGRSIRDDGASRSERNRAMMRGHNRRKR